MRLSGKTIVVVGGTGGIGSEVARGVVLEGGKVLLVARDPGRLAERVAEQISQPPARSRKGLWKFVPQTSSAAILAPSSSSVRASPASSLRGCSPTTASTSDVRVVDKARGVGGRVATRRLADGSSFDDGAALFDPVSEPFRRRLALWEADGLVERTGIDGRDGVPTRRVKGSATSLAKHLASGLDVRLGAKGVALALDGGASG